jgi:ribosomal protein S5
MRASKRANESQGEEKKEHEHDNASLPHPWLLCLPRMGRQTDGGRKALFEAYIYLRGEKRRDNNDEQKKHGGSLT